MVILFFEATFTVLCVIPLSLLIIRFYWQNESAGTVKGNSLIFMTVFAYAKQEYTYAWGVSGGRLISRKPNVLTDG